MKFIKVFEGFSKSDSRSLSCLRNLLKENPEVGVNEVIKKDNCRYVVTDVIPYDESRTILYVFIMDIDTKQEFKATIDVGGGLVEVKPV